MADHAGKIPVKKRVSRDGKTFDETFWVSPQEAKQIEKKRSADSESAKRKPKRERSDPSEHTPKDVGSEEQSSNTAPPASFPTDGSGALKDKKSFAAIISYFGGNPKLAQELVSGWQNELTHKDAIATRVALSGVMGIDSSRDIDRLESHSEMFLKGFVNRGKALLDRNRESVESLVKVSQSLYKEDTVVLYRGVSGDMATKLKNDHDKATTDVSVASDSLSCFSEDPAIAKKFAGSRGAIIQVKVPRSSIALSYRAFQPVSAKGGFAQEHEVVVATRGGFSVSKESLQFVGF